MSFHRLLNFCLVLLCSWMLYQCAASATPPPAQPTRESTQIPTLASTATEPTLAPTDQPTNRPTDQPTFIPPTRELATATALFTPTAPIARAATVAPSAAPASLSAIPRQPSELRGAWVHDNALVTREKVDEIVRRAELGHINAIFANVFTQGEALFESNLVNKSRLIKDDFDPLLYLVQEAHKRNIQVHAWFVNGPVDHDGKSAIIDKHPEWALVSADGATLPWLNFARPDVRQFLGDVMMETVTRYGVDGVHFDFTRYPGPQWGFDSYTVQAFNDTHNFDVGELRYADLPAYSYFEGNPIVNPTTAQVLATFPDGLPAVTLNQYGAGQALVLNWRASDRHLAVESEILKRAIQSMLKPNGSVYVFHSDQGTGNSEDYLIQANAWLTDLGWQPVALTASKLESLQPGSVVVMPNVYTLEPETASALAAFVEKGGGVIFIEAPTRSIEQEIVRALIGMSKRGKRLEEWTLMTATGDHPLVPASARSTDLAVYQARDEEWKQFRKDGITALVQSVRQRITSHSPKVELTVTISPQQEAAANQVLQDWRAWLDRGLIDFLIPRSYVPEVDALDPIISDWQPEMLKYKNVALGLSTFNGKGKARVTKAPEQLVAELESATAAGSSGVMFWNLDYMSDEELNALAKGPFRAVANP